MRLYQKNWRKIFFFLIIVVFARVSAQNPEEYNKIYTKTYIDISQKDFPRALKIADSLFSISETPRFKVRSLMLSASLLQQSGDIKKAIGYAVTAQQISNESDDLIWKAKISGFLATQYRQLKLFEQSKKYIDETIEATKKIKDQKIIDQTMGFIMQEKAYYELEMKDYTKSISYV
ncbi:MAG: AraC family transcriptional regulator, partial [Chryseobacterium sp.]|nr:AraC family transcriptional regulator [Chryseobacterium sp.]